MKYLKKYKLFEAKSDTWNKTNMMSFISSNGSYNVPVEALEEIVNWDIIHKSPFSLSFYNNREKTWDNTEDGTIRISNHWNFSRKLDKTIHAKTDVDVHNVWTKGIYDEVKSVYKIVKEYKLSDDNESLVRQLYKRLKNSTY